jgi:hypothetical protein
MSYITCPRTIVLVATIHLNCTTEGFTVTSKPLSPDSTQEEIDAAKADLDRSMQVATRSLFSDAELGAITTFADAAELLASKNVPVESSEDYGTGFHILPDKVALVNKPFLILSWRFNEGDFGDRGFVSVELITEDDKKYVMNDGSTGVCAQLHEISAVRMAKGSSTPQVGLIVKNGLTRTQYWYNETSGETSGKAKEGKGWVPASTYYLSA